MSKIRLGSIPIVRREPKKEELEFDIRDVQTRNPKTASKTQPGAFRTDHLIPRQYQPSKKWWEKS